MQNQNLIFNNLTFDFLEKEQTFYFSKEKTGHCQKIDKTIFPNEIEEIFPKLAKGIACCANVKPVKPSKATKATLH